MNSGKWTWFAILYQCGFAYAVSLMIYQIGGIFAGTFNVIGLIAALLVLGAMIYMLFIRTYKEAETLEGKVVVASKKERKSRK